MFSGEVIGAAGGAFYECFTRLLLAAIGLDSFPGRRTPREKRFENAGAFCGPEEMWNLPRRAMGIDLWEAGAKRSTSRFAGPVRKS